MAGGLLTVAVVISVTECCVGWSVCFRMYGKRFPAVQIFISSGAECVLVFR